MPAADGRHRGSGPGGHSGQVRWWSVPPPRRRGAAAALLAVVSALVLATGLTLLLVLVPAPPGADVAARLPALPTGADAAAAAPVRATELLIPDLGLITRLGGVGIDPAGVLVPPADPDVAAWFTGSAPPGDPGPSVLVGHVDSREGPGVFFGLAELDVGAEIEVRRSDGRSVTFRVVDVRLVPKDEFPTDRVYGPVPVPELRLITCGGEFDRAARHYLRNVVVTAVPVSP